MDSVQHRWCVMKGCPVGSRWRKSEAQKPGAPSVVRAAGTSLLGALTAMLGDEERKPRSLPVLPPASPRALGFRPSSRPGPCASDAREEFHFPNAETGAQRDDEGRCPRAHDHHLLLASRMQGCCPHSIPVTCVQWLEMESTGPHSHIF